MEEATDYGNESKYQEVSYESRIMTITIDTLMWKGEIFRVTPLDKVTTSD